MPGVGIAAAVDAHIESPATRIVMLTAFEDKADRVSDIEAGASGYVLKGVAGRELAAILRHVARGDRYVSARLAFAVLNRRTEAASKRR